MTTKQIFLLSFLITALVPITGFTDAPAPPTPPPVPPPQKAPGNRSPEQRHFDRSAAQIILRMSEEERAQMYKLQRENPAEYRQTMEQKIELWRAERAKKREEMEQLVNSYRSAPPEEKDKYKEEIAKMVAEDFRQRIEELKLMLKDAQKRVDHLSADVEKREKNFDQAVEVRVKFILENGLNSPPRRGK